MTPTPEPRREGIPAPVKSLSVVSLFNDFASEMVYPLLPALVTRTLGGGAVALSLIDGASELTSAVVKWLSGGLADRPGWRRLLILGGYLTAVLVRPLISVASAAWQVVGFRVIDRLGKGIRTPPRDALIAEVTPARLRGRAFGFHRGADHLGAVLGSLAAWWLVAVSANVREVIGWSIAPGLLAFAILAVTLRGVPDGGAGAGGGPQSERGRRASADAAGQRFWAPVLALAALTFCRIPELLLLLRLQQVGVAVAAVPLVWAALHVVRSAASYPGGWLTDRVGSRAAVAGGGLVFAAVATVMGLPLGAGGMAAVFLAFGLVAGLTESAERSLVARLAPVWTGRGFGAYHALTGLAALPASFVFGEIYQRVSPRAALWTSAAAVAAAVVGWLAASPRERVGGVIG